MQASIDVVFGPDVDKVEAELLTHDLQARLLECEVDDVRVLRDAVDARGAKAVDTIILGALTITLSPVVLKSLIGVAQTWIQARPVRTVKLKVGDDYLEVQAVSKKDANSAIEAFIERHSQD